MAFPNDLGDVVAFKIHPAIGIARMAKNDDHFVFGDPQQNYKSNGLMKRQAVKFRIFAYGANHVGLGELTPAIMGQLGITPVWSANVANQKIRYREERPLGDQTHVIAARASSDTNGGQLIGTLPDFAEGAQIPLGQITADGTFIPPKSTVHRKQNGLPVPSFPEHTAEIADGSCDGTVTCQLNGAAAQLPMLEACIIVAPGDYSPEVDPEPNAKASLLLRLRQDVAPDSGGATGTLHNATARSIDELALRSCTGDFSPGFEVSFGFEGEVPDIKALFYRPGVDPHIDPRDIRVRYKNAAGEPGAVRGQLTSGCCSPWQTDFTACTGYWSENLPVRAYLDESDNVNVNVYRKQYANHAVSPPRLRTGDDYELHQDKIGIARLRNGKLIETERGPGDDIP